MIVEMLFRRNVLDRISRGEVTLAFRRWRRAPPAEGSTLRTAVGVLVLTGVRMEDERAITDGEARQAGFTSRVDLLASLAPEGTIYRMHVRIGGDDQRVALRGRRLEGTDESSALIERLAALERRSGHRWVQPLLELVGANAGMAARDLADRTMVDRTHLKRQMRTLKELGLTESLQTGYRLSPRGHDALAALRRAPN